jgi:carbamoyl-phosphate synthase large subunit
MKSTGEVMGLDTHFGGAFAKAQLAAGNKIACDGAAFISVNDYDKMRAMPIARQLYDLGFHILATEGTFKALRKEGIPAKMLKKVGQGRPNAVDLIINREIKLVINTPLGKIARTDEYSIGRTALANGVPCLTTLSAAWAMVQAIRSVKNKELSVVALQE